MEQGQGDGDPAFASAGSGAPVQNTFAIMPQAQPPPPPAQAVSMENSPQPTFRGRVEDIAKLYALQTVAILRKNWLLSLRGWKVSVTRLIVPSVFIIVYALILRAVSDGGDLHPPVRPFSMNIPRCWDTPCRTLVYHPAEPYAYEVMRQVAERNEPRLRITPLGAAPSPEDDVVPIDTVLGGKQLTWLLRNNSGTIDGTHRILAGVAFFNYTSTINQSTYWDAPERVTELNPGDLAYEVVFNETEQCPFLSFGDCPMPNNYRLQVTASVEQALASVLTNRTVTFNLKLKDYPAPVTAGVVVASLGLMFVFLAATFSLVFIFSQVCGEKETGMRGYLKIQGLKDAVVWVTWFVENFALHMIASLIFLGVAYAWPGVDLFRKTDFSVFFVLMLTYGMAIVPWAFAWTTVCRTTRAGTILGFVFFAFGLILGIVVCIMQTIFYLLYTQDAYKHIGNLPAMLIVFPPFHFCKVMLDIQTRSLVQYMQPSSSPYPPGFKWADMYNSQYPDAADVPPAITNIWFLVMNFVIYSVLTWYLDKVIPDNHKATLPPWFLFTRSYWGIHPGKEDPEVETESSALLHNRGVAHNLTDDDLLQERYNVAGESSLALKVRALGKTFEQLAAVRAVLRLFMGRRTPSMPGDVHALVDFHFGARVGQLVCVLGHNGAGKTTLLNILTGKQSGFTGNAWIFGKNVRYQMADIAEFMGACPQFDILWPDLSAREHLEIISQFKLSSCGMGRKQIDALLNDVRLLSVADQASSTFSGGMKRRLSVVISTVGNPKIIFMDEPTTGMDPQNRRYVWELIQRIKVDKVIVLTTHSMEEADSLGEKIGIMAGGQLRGVGNSLHLKQKFGSGYRLSFVVDVERINEVKMFVGQSLPSARLSEENAGSLVYSLATLESDEVHRFFSQLQEMQVGGAGPVRDWGIQNTTLEDVFMAVAHQSSTFTDALLRPAGTNPPS